MSRSDFYHKSNRLSCMLRAYVCMHAYTCSTHARDSAHQAAHSVRNRRRVVQYACHLANLYIAQEGYISLYGVAISEMMMYERGKKQQRSFFLISSAECVRNEIRTLINQILDSCKTRFIILGVLEILITLQRGILKKSSRC